MLYNFIIIIDDSFFFKIENKELLLFYNVLKDITDKQTLAWCSLLPHSSLDMAANLGNIHQFVMKMKGNNTIR